MTKNELSDAELETYARQIVLEDILVGMGIGYLRIVDRDIVSRSDLHRQDVYDVDSLGEPKVEVALRKLSRLNPDVTIDPHAESINSINAEELIAGMDVVLDGLDRPEPRYIVNRTCNRLKIPYIFGAAIQTLGNTTTIVPGKTLCLECFMPGLSEDDLPKCAVVGVHPSVLGIVTAVQSFEAVRIIMGQKPLLLDKLLYIDLADMSFNTLKLRAREDCPVCGKNPKDLPQPVKEKFYEETCARDGRRNFIITPKRRVELDLDQVAQIVSEKGFSIKSRGKLGITFVQRRGILTSILESGTMILQTPPLLTEDFKEQALEFYRSILVDGLGLPPSILPDI
ncbi:MAG: HesA/MoeB/ThiF family protein [Deltaproteobacteria bacterium]|nr:HesA/MoeB/ThiF family protein [Deltaproteobacteria bacterium]